MPFSQTDDFEAGFGNWVNVGGDDFDWSRVNTSTPSSGTGPSAGNPGFYVYTETSAPIANSQEALLQSNVLDGSAYIFTIDFDEHAAGAAMDSGGYIALEAFKNSTWTEVYRQTGQNGAIGDGLGWVAKSVNLDAQAGGPYDNADLQLRFRVHVSDSGSAFQNDFALDNIVITGADRNAYEQEGFRFRNDDGNEANATWRQNQDVDDTAGIAQNVRLRILTDATGDPGAEAATLQYKRSDEDATQWRDV